MFSGLDQCYILICDKFDFMVENSFKFFAFTVTKSGIDVWNLYNFILFVLEDKFAFGAFLDVPNNPKKVYIFRKLSDFV